MNTKHDILHMMQIDVLNDQHGNEMMVIKTPTNVTYLHASTTVNRSTTTNIILKQS